MPKAFSEPEKERIRAQFRQKGRALFESRGIRKTSVDDLVKAAGISKGAFYIFYQSKEELLMEILEEIEADIQGSIMDHAIKGSRGSAEEVAAILKSMLLTWDKYPLLRQFGRDEYEYLVRKLPIEKVMAHARRDDEFTKKFIKKIKDMGIKTKTPPRVIGNLIKSLFFMGLHRDEISETGYYESTEILIRLIAEHITKG